jgi:hypothetical protein
MVHTIHTFANPLCFLQVFFVDDKTMPGWSVVVKKEARGRRINPEDEDHSLGQETCTADMQVATCADLQRTGREESAGSEEACEPQGGRRRRRTVGDL